jgi:hypothetical protein
MMPVLAGAAVIPAILAPVTTAVTDTALMAAVIYRFVLIATVIFPCMLPMAGHPDIPGTVMAIVSLDPDIFHPGVFIVNRVHTDIEIYAGSGKGILREGKKTDGHAQGHQHLFHVLLLKKFLPAKTLGCTEKSTRHASCSSIGRCRGTWEKLDGRYLPG